MSDDMKHLALAPQECSLPFLRIFLSHFMLAYVNNSLQD